MYCAVNVYLSNRIYIAVPFKSALAQNPVNRGSVAFTEEN